MSVGWSQPIPLWYAEFWFLFMVFHQYQWYVSISSRRPIPVLTVEASLPLYLSWNVGPCSMFFFVFVFIIVLCICVFASVFPLMALVMAPFLSGALWRKHFHTRSFSIATSDRDPPLVIDHRTIASDLKCLDFRFFEPHAPPCSVQFSHNQ